MIAAGSREAYAAALRGLLAPGGHLVVISARELTDTLVVDIQDAGFVQRRVAQANPHK